MTIARAAGGTTEDPVEALAVSSLGEAMVPVTRDRQVLGPSIIGNFDQRGKEYLAELQSRLSMEGLYSISGNTIGNNYSITKLMWIRDNWAEQYLRADKFLLWGSFVSYMLGADPAVDFSLANRTLLFDLALRTWSPELLELADLEGEKLPVTVPAGSVIGTVDSRIAEELGLPTGVRIVCGAHDQCATAVGCGVLEKGQAVYSMGTFTCITPVFSRLRPPQVMLELGLNTEHHAAPGRYVSFIYNAGGSMVKWFRDTFAGAEHRQAEEAGRDIYAELMGEMPEGPSGLVVLPHFATTGPPAFIPDSASVIAGARLETTRGQILKAVIEGSTFGLKECVDSLPPTGIEVQDFRVVGGGSKSDHWIQVCADIFGRPFVRPAVTEAGALGAAIIAGVGSELFPSFQAGVEAMVRPGERFEPDQPRHTLYRDWFELFKELWPTTAGFLRTLASRQAGLSP